MKRISNDDVLGLDTIPESLLTGEYKWEIVDRDSEYGAKYSLKT